MRLMNQYCLFAEDFEVIQSSGVELKTYLVGTFLSDMYDAELDDITNNLRVSDFAVYKHSDGFDSEAGAWEVYVVELKALSDVDCCRALLQLRERFPEETDWVILA